MWLVMYSFLLLLCILLGTTCICCFSFTFQTFHLIVPPVLFFLLLLSSRCSTRPNTDWINWATTLSLPVIFVCPFWVKQCPSTTTCTTTLRILLAVAASHVNVLMKNTYLLNDQILCYHLVALSQVQRTVRAHKMDSDGVFCFVAIPSDTSGSTSLDLYESCFSWLCSFHRSLWHRTGEWRAWYRSFFLYFLGQALDGSYHTLGHLQWSLRIGKRLACCPGFDCGDYYSLSCEICGTWNRNREQFFDLIWSLIFFFSSIYIPYIKGRLRRLPGPAIFRKFG